jgi:uncharacterized secreted protein with C-terminal beta-propeller domain
MTNPRVLVRIVGLLIGAFTLCGCDNVSEDTELEATKADLSMLVPANGCGDALAQIKEKIVSDMEKQVNANLEKALEKVKSNTDCYTGNLYDASVQYAAPETYLYPSGAAGSGGASYSHSGSAGSSASVPATSNSPSTSSDSSARIGSSSTKSATDYSTTNNQVVGVDEADFVKNDPSYIYIVADGRFQIISAWPAAQSHEIGSVAIEGEPTKLYVLGDTAVVYSSQNYLNSASNAYSYTGYSSTSSDQECTYGYSCEFSGDGRALAITVFDISDRTTPIKVREITMNGSYLNSRRIENIVHTVATFPEVAMPTLLYQPNELQAYSSTCYQTNEFHYSEKAVRAMYDLLKLENREKITSIPLSTFLPVIKDTRYEDGQPVVDDGLLETCKNFYVAKTGDGRGFLSLLSFDMSKVEPISTTTIIGKPGAVYASIEALYVAVRHYASAMQDWFYEDADKDPEATTIHKFALSPDSTKTTYVGSGVAKGRILNQFSMDEYNGDLRIATTTGHLPDTNAHNTLSVLAEQSGALKVVGMLDQIAPSEDIRSVRFNGDVGFIVTFKKTDPLFVLDLTDPTAPVIKGELKIPGFSTYMHVMDETHLMTIGYDADDQGDFAWFQGVQLQIMDVRDLANPVLVHKEVIGTRGSTSEAATDHLAFNYFPERSLLAIPMTICEGGSGGTYGNVMTFSGLLVYKVTIEDGFEKLGGVPHKTPETSYSGACDNWWTDSNSIVQRSIFMSDDSADYVYSVAYDSMDVSNLKDLETPLVKVPLTAVANSNGTP